MRLKTLGKSPVRIRKFTDHGPNTGFYGPHVDQSHCRILQSHIIMWHTYKGWQSWKIWMHYFILDRPQVTFLKCWKSNGYILYMSWQSSLKNSEINNCPFSLYSVLKVWLFCKILLKRFWIWVFLDLFLAIKCY